jgi:hypothetical protein
MKYAISILICVALWLAPSCASDPIVAAVLAKNPRCSVAQVDRSGHTVLVTLHCPYGETKTVKMHETQNSKRGQ